MNTTLERPPVRQDVKPSMPSVPAIPLSDLPYAHQAFTLLQVGFVVAPIVAGVDKFYNLLVNWTHYLSPLVTRVVPMSADAFMRMAGVIEIVAGVIVWVKPKIGAFIVAAWLAGIVINLLSIPGFYDIALRDLGLCLGALALGRLSHLYDH